MKALRALFSRQTHDGDPQGGVTLPLPANLFLHYAFDQWMAREFSRLLLGSRLNQVHQVMIAAMATAEWKFRASLSYRVATRRQSLSRQKARSIRLRRL